ncbi:MAG: hypothetical protein RR140_02595 [Clostridia bacterium]
MKKNDILNSKFAKEIFIIGYICSSDKLLTNSMLNNLTGECRYLKKVNGILHTSINGPSADVFALTSKGYVFIDDFVKILSNDSEEILDVRYFQFIPKFIGQPIIKSTTHLQDKYSAFASNQISIKNLLEISKQLNENNEFTL